MLVPDRGSVRSLRMPACISVILGGSLLSLLVFGVWGGWQVWQGEARDHHIQALENQLAMVLIRHQDQIGRLNARIDSDRKQLAVYVRNIMNVNPNAIDDSLKRLDSRLASMDTQLAAIDYLLEKKRMLQAAKPHAWPTEGGWISSRYGMRIDPFNGGREMHRGLDIANRFGAPVLAASRGIVTFAGKMQGFGNMIDIDHGYGYVTRYGHMSSITVRAGDTVADGQLIGRIGSRGRSTGPHLHYEVHRYGRSINPGKYLPRG